MNETSELSIEELALATGLPVRTIRFYITEGLLPGPGTRGKAATYTADHRRRLALIRQLVEKRVPLREIRERVAGLSPDAVSEVLATESERTAELHEASATASPKEYIALLLDRARPARQEPRPDVPASSRPPPSSSASPRPMARPAPAGTHGSDAARSEGSPLPNLPTPARSWERWELAPGVELHVRADATLDNARLIRRLLEAARQSQEPRD